MHPLLAANEEWIVFGSVIKEVVDRQWADEPIDLLHRRVLRTLREKGPITLADLARERCVTRQFARKVIGQITEIDLNFITAEPNPAHKTSTLISLTDAGLAYINRHDEDVSSFIEERLRGKVCDNDLAITLNVIRAARSLFENWVVLYDHNNGNSDDELDPELSN